MTLIDLWVYTRLTLTLNIFLKRLNKSLIITVLSLSGNAKAYIADRCDWMDCEAMATGTDEGNGFALLIVIVIGVIIYLNSK